MSSKVLTIVFTDIKGFTERTSGADRDFAVRLRARHDELLKPIVARYEGRLVKTIGDAFLLTFESPTNAVLCALMMQVTLRQYNKVVQPEEKIEIRVAINTGEVSVQDGDILGEPVNVASRVEGITEANEVWFTEATYLAMNKQEVPTSLVGEFRLKGVPEAMKVYQVVQDPGSDAYQRVLKTQARKWSETDSLPAQPAPSKGGYKALLVLLLLVAVAFIGHHLHAGRQFQNMLETTDSAITAGRLEEADQTIGDLLRRNAAHPQARALAGRLFLARMRAIVAKDDLPGGKALLEQTYQRWPFLQPDLGVEAVLTVGEAFHLVNQGQKDEAQQLIDTLIATHPNHPESLMEAFRFYDKTGIHWRRPFEIMGKMEALQPGRIASEPTFGENLEYYLEKVDPAEGLEEMWSIIPRYYREAALQKLTAALYDPDPARRQLRWNARAYLPRLASISINPFRFHACALADPEPDIYQAPFAETMAFFREPEWSETASRTVAEDKFWIASLTPLIDAAQRQVEQTAGDWARRNQDVASYSLFLDACRKALFALNR